MEENVPYIIGQHDVIALLGKVNNLERNVITLVIGENENYKDILAANYDGSLGSGSGEDIHHQGYDYHAQQIYEQLVNYDNNQIADRWKKSYWIVGYGTGGSIANLVAKKFIDYKHVNTNVYCYTYQAPGTINRNNIPSGKKIHNTKYYSIFNHINTDDPLIQLESEDFDRYGRDKKVAAGYSNNLSDIVTIDNSLLYGNQNNSINSFLMNYNINVSNIEDGLVRGFSFTEDISKVINNFRTWVYSLLYRFKPQSEVIDIAENNGELQEGLTAKNVNNKYGKAIETSKDLKYQDKVIVRDSEISPKLEIVKKLDGNNENPILSHIIKMAQYYINNIPTHDKTVETLSATTKALLYHQYINNAENHPFDIYEYPEARNIKEITKPSFYSTTENAIIPLSGKFIYYYDGFRDLITEEQKGIYNNWANGVKTEEEKDFNIYAHYIGNDCTGFSQAVMYDMELDKGSNNPRGQNGIVGNCYGLYNHNDYAGLYANRSKTTDVKDRFRNLEVALMNLGYERHDAKDMSIEQLQPGDLLCANDHVEYYVGNNFDLAFNGTDETDRERKKKAGIENVEYSNNRKLTKTRYQYNSETKEYEDSGLIAAQGTFGWGSVHDEFPVENNGGEMYFFKKSSDDKFFQLYTSWNGTDGKKYTSVWRYERWQK